MTESLVALVSAILVIRISTVYPLFSTNQCHIENMQHLCLTVVREMVERPLALVVSGLNPSLKSKTELWYEDFRAFGGPNMFSCLCCVHALR